MWVILSESNDLVALWLFEGLTKKGIKPLEWVKADSLEYGTNWTHRLSSDNVSTSFTLSDGRTIDTVEIKGVINRLRRIPVKNLLLFHPSEREYVTHEIMTFFISWLYSLPGPVLNRPTAQGLSGNTRHPSEWILLADIAGLPTREYHYSDNNDYCLDDGYILNFQEVFVAENFLMGENISQEIKEGCLKLAKLAETSLLGLTFASDAQGRKYFMNANPYPDIRSGGEQMLNILTKILTGKNKQP
jgi:hypothetical protein